jgi:hypothetical protein
MRRTPPRMEHPSMRDKGDVCARQGNYQRGKEKRGHFGPPDRISKGRFRRLDFRPDLPRRRSAWNRRPQAMRVER